MKKKKLLILSASGGFGHIRAGEALLDYAKEHIPLLRAEHVDVATIDLSLKRYAVWYEVMSKKAPWLWRMIYDYLPAPLIQGAAALRGLVSGSINRYILEKKPDAILFTNVVIFPMAQRAIDKLAGNVRVGMVVTDYHAHRYYKSRRISRYFVATAQVARDLVRVGIPMEKISVTGIPINPRFYVPQDIAELKTKYGTNNHLPVVLVIASFAVSPAALAELARELLDLSVKINLMVLCNGRSDLYEALARSSDGHPRFHVVNWTNTMEEYIKMADVVVSKAGGLTVSECLSLRKTMVVVRPIPGQEEYNAEFLERIGLGRRARTIGQVAVLVRQALAENPVSQASLLPPENPCKKIFQSFLQP